MEDISHPNDKKRKVQNKGDFPSDQGNNCIISEYHHNWIPVNTSFRYNHIYK